MTDYKKYMIFDFDDMLFEGLISLEDWLNDMYENNYELITVYNNHFIFKNKYYTSMKQVEDFLEK